MQRTRPTSGTSQIHSLADPRAQRLGVPFRHQRQQQRFDVVRAEHRRAVERLARRRPRELTAAHPTTDRASTRRGPPPDGAAGRAPTEPVRPAAVARRGGAACARAAGRLPAADRRRNPADGCSQRLDDDGCGAARSAPSAVCPSAACATDAPRAASPCREARTGPAAHDPHRRPVRPAESLRLAADLRPDVVAATGRDDGEVLARELRILGQHVLRRAHVVQGALRVWRSSSRITSVSASRSAPCREVHLTAFRDDMRLLADVQDQRLAVDPMMAWRRDGTRLMSTCTDRRRRRQLAPHRRVSATNHIGHWQGRSGQVAWMVGRRDLVDAHELDELVAARLVWRHDRSVRKYCSIPSSE